MKYKEGEIVHVKLAGLIVPAIIKGTRKNGDYIVQFEGGTEKDVTEKNIKPVEGRTTKLDYVPPKLEPRSPSRRSPSRRSPARTTSPSRRTKASPSPSRKKNVTPKTPARILKVSLQNLDASGDFSTNLPRKRKPVEHVPDSTIEQTDFKLLTSEKIIETEEIVTNFSLDTDRIVHLKQNEKIVNDIGKFSDDEIDKPQERKSELKILRPPREFGGWLGSLFLTFFIPGIVLALHTVCNKNVCSYTKLPNLSEYKLLSTYFDIKAFAMYFAYILIIAVLSKIPYIGKTVKSQPSKDKIYEYRMNGLFSAFVILGTLIALEAQNVPVVNFLVDEYFHLLASAVIFAVTFSVFFFIRSKFIPVSQLNPYAVTYNFIYDFFLGRQVNPRVLGIDIKMVLLRTSHIAILILNSVYLFKSLHITVISDSIWSLDNVTLDSALLVCSTLQILYVLDKLVFEPQLTTTFELQYEGLGYMKTMMYAVYPFLMTASTKYLYEHSANTNMCPWLLSGITTVFIMGYIIYRGSNSQKNAFRINPYDPALAYLESMPTGQGKKLLISGWWGKLRHPNYTGDIIMHLSLGALCVGSPAALGTLPPALFLAARAAYDSQRCQRRYGAAWDRYAHRVRYTILPPVY